ncbi:MAG TPA: AAA family ATPase [Ktedonobacteraceae bacterium]|nr:AAA family ATPase [Ktedonobacteraceae bacterium]
MIILKHLKVERFRLLREVDLQFPQRGSILISGPNEAGKSTVLESIYFALYGEPLTAAYRVGTGPGAQLQAPALHAASSLNELIHYGEQQAVVTLSLAIGAKEMSITRIIERDKGQTVSLDVRQLGMPPEKNITDLNAANERIVAELGRIDGKTLRHSCLIEQKGLNRLEILSGREREVVLRNMLGLEKLARLAEHFRLTTEDERLLEQCAERLKLAEIQARIPELSQKLGELEAALDTITICEDLAAISQQEAEIAEQQLALEHVAGRRVELKSRQHRITQLKKADATLQQIITAYDVIADAQRELPELEHEIAELERREKEELPALEQRVRDLADLTRSFGTLERMATDLLNAVSTIKELEQGLKQQEHLQETLADLEEQIAHTRQLVEDAQQSRHELEEQHRSTRPQLEMRLKRLQSLSEKLTALQQAEETRTRRAGQRQQADENAQQIDKLRQELKENEEELALVESETKQVQEKADAAEKRWRQLSIRRQLQEWQRFKGMAEGIAEAQQHVEAADQQRAQLNANLLATQRAARTRLGIVVVGVVLAVLCGAVALVEIHHSSVFAAAAGMAALVLLAVSGANLQNYGKTSEKEREADRQLQEAINRVGMMVAARETALRMNGNGNQQALAQIEHEIYALGAAIPRSIEEAQFILQQLPEQGESLADVQQQMTERRDQALAARDQLNVTMEAVAALRKKRAALQELRKQEGWEDLDDMLHADQQVIEQLQNEIVLAAGQEGLPVPNYNLEIPSEPVGATLVVARPTPGSGLKTTLAETIKTTQYEIALLAGKMDTLPDISAKARVHQEALDVLLARKQTVMERNEQFQTNNPMRQIERAREQQIALRDALRSLQDSLRQRVQPLGVSFGQTAISTAETTARKQLDALQVALGRKEELQNRYTSNATILKESQESLSEYYRKLARFSGTLGNWIVPPNPFADALRTLRERCDREIQEADGPGILSEMEALKIQEGAIKAKIELCQHDIEEAQERIATMLAQRNRPPAKGYTFADITAVWPLVSEHSPDDRARLEGEVSALDLELRALEQQDLALSEQLETGKNGENALDLEQARKRMAQQQRSFQTKERAGLLIAATFDRLMRKMLPRTEYYMQQLLPLLTRGRYHDARLTTEPEEGISSGGPLQVSLWEPAANAYIPLPALSGGAADQVSLALRLAFAIAALPRELNAAPGFLLLDEPLSLASRDRAQSLVAIVTGETLCQHFEQILFVSHDASFDASSFSHHIYIDGGLIVETNLPMNIDAAQDMPAQPENGTYAPSDADLSTDKQEVKSLETVSNMP